MPTALARIMRRGGGEMMRDSLGIRGWCEARRGVVIMQVDWGGSASRLGEIRLVGDMEIMQGRSCKRLEKNQVRERHRRSCKQSGKDQPTSIVPLLTLGEARRLLARRPPPAAPRPYITPSHRPWSRPRITAHRALAGTAYW
ncbi:hypothetical protein VC83_07783 [Pseudogymnoascus destructans]|uniref:Uncharacterized protein n=1 Tax=Pseudogymnoascus destructans TaxID=655981 RepID=A0A177A2F4_9PEZI|nr:uncharacterized protein VC83_07783 [Pseudogymnoascus destructans]OAF55770.1 hypothetical protein VC83_07783 [Pseudogymnoascus destructans]